MLMLKGAKILFRVGLAIFHIIKKQLLKCKTEDILLFFEKIPLLIADAGILIQVSNMPQYKDKNKEIELIRKKLRDE